MDQKNRRNNIQLTRIVGRHTQNSSFSSPFAGGFGPRSREREPNGRISRQLIEENMKRSVIVPLGIALVVAFGLAGYLLSKHMMTESNTPRLIIRSGDAVASGEFKNAQKTAEFYRDEIRDNPDVVKNYVELAQLFLQEARATGLHHEYIEKAEWLLDEAHQREPENFEILLAHASVSMIKHQFSEARTLAEKAIAKNSYSATAHGILCDALVELGEYDKAVVAGEHMLAIRPDMRSYARASYLRELHGDFAGAKEAMLMAGEGGIRGQENRAWAFYNLGKLYFNEGALDTAEFIFKGILEERPGYAYALSGLANIRFLQGKTEESIKLLKDAFASMPEHLFVEQLADLYRAIGDTDNAEAVTETVLAEFKHHRDAGWNVDKEFARFCADHEINLPEALERARAEYERRPKNIEVLDVLAWTIYKAVGARNAVPYIEKALQMKTTNATVSYHAGIIFSSAGMTEKARPYLERTLQSNAGGSMLYLQNAQRTFASLR